MTDCRHLDPGLPHSVHCQFSQARPAALSFAPHACQEVGLTRPLDGPGWPLLGAQGTVPRAAGRLRFMFWALYLGSCSSKPGKWLAVRSEVIPGLRGCWEGTGLSGRSCDVRGCGQGSLSPGGRCRLGGHSGRCRLRGNRSGDTCGDRMV